MARSTPSPSLSVAVTAIAVILWSTGPPGSQAVTDDMLKIACEDMTPRHDGIKAEDLYNVSSPFRLVVGVSQVEPGTLVYLKLTSVEGITPFKGFMVQARDGDDRIIGTFLPDCMKGPYAPKHMITCATGNEPFNAAVQSNNKYKTSVEFLWIAPLIIKPPLKFKYTVVHDFENFWANEETDVIPVKRISPEDFKIKNSTNIIYNYYTLYMEHCYP